MKQQHTSYFTLCALLSLALALPGCKWFDYSETSSCSRKSAPNDGVEYPDPSDTSDVVATIGGKPLVTTAMVEKQYQETLKNPQVSELLSINPGFEFEIKKQIIQALVAPAVITACVYEKGLHDCDEYRTRLSDLVKNATHMVNIEAFQKGLNVQVSPSDVKAFYDENKNQIPEFLVSRGGVKAQGVSFANDADAQAFVAKAKGKSGEFEKAAQEAGVANSFKDFKLVNATTATVDPVVRAKLVEWTSFPKMEVIKASDGSVWVINAVAKEEAKYAPFESVKDRLEEHVKQQKEQEVGQKTLDEYKKQLNIEVNDNYYQDQMGKKSADAIEQLKEAFMMEQQTAAQEPVSAPSRVV